MANPQQTLLDEISEHLSLAAQHSARASALLTMLHDQAPALGPNPLALPNSAVGGAILSSNPHSLNIWAEWLKDHGPSFRQAVWDGTGTNLSAGAMKNVLLWKGPMTLWDDTAVLPDTVCRIPGVSGGRGRPPTIYFTWSQRYDVRPLFGVGPERPEDPPEDPTIDSDLGLKYFERVTAEDELTPEDEALIQELLDRAGRPQEAAETPPGRYSTLDEWNDAWAGLFDSLVATESKPTDEQKQMLRDSLPDGADVAALALGYQAAVIRRREAPQTLLGVIQPPPSE